MIRPRKVFLFGLPAVILALAGSFYWPVPRSRLAPGGVVSLRLTDRNGVLLREILSPQGGRCRWVGLGDVSSYLIAATLAAEDQDFYFHRGIHLPSIGRALEQNIRRRHIFSGASTITQQVVRSIFHVPRTIPGKIFEMWLALRLENTVAKEDILVQYLNRIPYGNQAFGAEAASLLYFDKPAVQLTLAESAYLACIPRAPSRVNPYRNAPELRMRQREILNRMRASGQVKSDEHKRALEETIVLAAESEHFRAPHFCDMVMANLARSKLPSAGCLRTTLDWELQKKVEILLRAHLDALKRRNITNGAVVVTDNTTGDILALTGSRDYADASNDGQVNGALALRQPGSALKPFTYCLALELGMTAASVVEDTLSQFPGAQGAYWPENYDRRFHGPVRVRSALACSYNVPAVSVLEKIGLDRLYRTLVELGFDGLTAQPPSYYGVALTLGDGEVRLLELVDAYRTLARGGSRVRDRSILEMADREGRSVVPLEDKAARTIFSPQASFIITHILADADARTPAFGHRTPLTLPFPCAVKTGTSKDYRDNWTVGYTTRFTVGVWVGNFDGRPMHNVSGITGCGPLFHDIMLLLHKDGYPESFREPPGLVRRFICPASGALASSACPGRAEELFVKGTEPLETCSLSHAVEGVPAIKAEAGPTGRSEGLRIAFPLDGDVFKIDPELPLDDQAVRLRVTKAGVVGADRVEWYVNGNKIGDSDGTDGLDWKLRTGSYTIWAVAVSGAKTTESRPVRITVLS